MARTSPLLALPLVLAAGLGGLFLWGMGRDNPDQLPSALVGRAASVMLDPLGQAAPFTDADLADGRVKIVNFWASWCAPCRAEMPELDALQKEMGGDRFEVVAVNVDTGDDVKPKKFLEETGVKTLGFYRDNTLDLFNDLKKRGLALGLPVTLLIDGEGCLLAHMNGPAAWASEDAKALIKAATAG